MNKKHLTVPVLKRSLGPLLQNKQHLEAIYVYGSAVRPIEGGKSHLPSRKETEGVRGAFQPKAGDIDVLILLNDTENVSEKAIQKVELACQKIKDSGKKAGLEFHFQPPKLLTRWWHTLIEGEPWIISSLKEPVIVYDRKGVVKEVCSFIEKEHIYNKEEKAERLLERSDLLAMSNRQLLLGAIGNLANAGTEAAQILLLFDGKFMLNKREIVHELEKNYVKTLGRDVVDTYTEIVDLEEKISKGTLSEFSAENLDYYLERLKIFIGKVEKMLGKK
jgi:predicted nucleotidyltransferase